MFGTSKNQQAGFTLIELSLVLVIIGLIVGGILVGRDLISASAIRAQVTQIERYNQAANTFYGKYGYLPGDVTSTIAANAGFAARGRYGGEGDGNGKVEGINYNAAGSYQGQSQSGETLLFWMDLSAASLIDGSFTTASAILVPALPATAMPLYLPNAAIGRGNYVNVWSGGTGATSSPDASNGTNYFAISNMAGTGASAVPQTSPGLSVREAYMIDSKVDDGLPQSGRVFAAYTSNINLSYWGKWAGVADASNLASTAATAGSTSTCYDNSATANGTPGVSGAAQHYSIEISNGSYVKCGLSFAFQ